ncbi:alpha-1,2-fucosyltransferase [Salinibius halmophilus]|uniref:alpha-1,2-fucosyltransferase n=1 Tax=Salinibius halmophilus TaxID=1853216 RepID=UPI000E66B734|nr:alpha-1,2-fucosyltransferase [Salinibius halmophilus]
MFKRSKNKIIVVLRGGLGNQLFQLAAAAKVASGNGFYVYDYHVDSSTIRKYLNGMEFIDRQSFLRVSRTTGLPFLDRLLLAGYKRVPKSYRWYWYWDEDSSANEMTACRPRNIILDGYWQSIEFTGLNEVYLRGLINHAALSESYYNAKAYIENNANVCVHVRRGDYQTPQFAKKFDVCGVDYYLKAFKLLKERLSSEGLSVCFFSNDIGWVSKYLSGVPDQVIDVGGYNLTDFEEMLLIGSLKNAVIPNSTFSWWGVVMTGEKEIVVCPKSWFAHEDRESLVSDDWYRL